jgi:hypothetical protein
MTIGKKNLDKCQRSYPPPGRWLADLFQGSLISHAAQGFGGNAQVRSDHMLRHAVGDIRGGFYKVQVFFFGGVTDSGVNPFVRLILLLI